MLGDEAKRAEVMVGDAILAVLETNEGAVSFDKLRRILSHVSHVSLRFHLARLLERGSVERIGDSWMKKGGPKAARADVTWC
jgi:DNA-binding transcriptional ArsR family regulator